MQHSGTHSDLQLYYGPLKQGMSQGGVSQGLGGVNSKEATEGLQGEGQYYPTHSHPLSTAPPWLLDREGTTPGEGSDERRAEVVLL